jgi:hypothetical protein
MENKLLILSVFVLASCQPSELDRCIEANNTFTQLDVTSYEEVKDEESIKDIMNCSFEEQNNLNSKFYDAQTIEMLTEKYEYCAKKIKEKYKVNAIKICNSQGIY